MKTTYQYLCDKCGILEKLFEFSKAPEKTKCACGETAFRYYGSMSFVLKGGNWPGKEGKQKRKEVDVNDVDNYVCNPKRDGSAYGK